MLLRAVTGMIRGKIVVAALALCAGSWAPTALAEGDVKAGERSFKKYCASCHTTRARGMNLGGPNLHGIIGAPAGRAETRFFYSDAHRDSGVVFTEPELDRYMADFQSTVPGTKKASDGLADPRMRADIIAYLREATR